MGSGPVERGVIIESSAAAVAKTLVSQSGSLSKKKIGEYLGNGDVFNQEVLSKFLEEYLLQVWSPQTPPSLCVMLRPPTLKSSV